MRVTGTDRQSSRRDQSGACARNSLHRVDRVVGFACLRDWRRGV